MLHFYFLSKKKLNFLFPCIYIFSCAVLLVFLYQKNGYLEYLSQTIEPLEKKAQTLQKKRWIQEQNWQKVQKSNPNYLVNRVEAISLLKAERDRIHSLAKQYPDNPLLQERVAFFQEGTNRILFLPQSYRIGSQLLERELKLQNSVQMDEEELREVLSFLEEETIPEKPFLLIKEFTLSKKKEKGDERVYEVKFDIIERTPGESLRGRT